MEVVDCQCMGKACADRLVQGWLARRCSDPVRCVRARERVQAGSAARVSPMEVAGLGAMSRTQSSAVKHAPPSTSTIHPPSITSPPTTRLKGHTATCLPSPFRILYCLPRDPFLRRCHRQSLCSATRAGARSLSATTNTRALSFYSSARDTGSHFARVYLVTPGF